MKHRYLLILPSLFFIILTGTECKKHKPSNPVDQLPPETQVGANTFGCLVNGKVFVPKGPSLSPILTCYYQFLNNNYSKGYFFQVHAIRRGTKDCELTAISLDTDSITIQENEVFDLSLISPGYAGGRYSYYPGCAASQDYKTNNKYKGSLTIKKFDETNQIVSGTFWFNAVNANGDTVHVTEGRFDMQFTK